MSALTLDLRETIVFMEGAVTVIQLYQERECHDPAIMQLPHDVAQQSPLALVALHADHLSAVCCANPTNSGLKGPSHPRATDRVQLVAVEKQEGVQASSTKFSPGDCRSGLTDNVLQLFLCDCQGRRCHDVVAGSEMDGALQRGREAGEMILDAPWWRLSSC